MASARTDSQTQDHLDLLHHFRICISHISIVLHQIQQNTLSNRDERPERDKAAELSSRRLGQIVMIKPDHQETQHTHDPILIHAVALRHKRRPECIHNRNHKRNHKQHDDKRPHLLFLHAL